MTADFTLPTRRGSRWRKRTKRKADAARLLFLQMVADPEENWEAAFEELCLQITAYATLQHRGTQAARNRLVAGLERAVNRYETLACGACEIGDRPPEDDYCTACYAEGITHA